MKDEDLIRRFADLTDEALLARIESGNLTERAESVALAEAARRGLNIQHNVIGEVEEDVLPANYVQLSRYLQPMEAYILQGRLQAEGINTHLSGAKTIEANPLWFNAMGGVRMFVPSAQYERAKEIIESRDEGHYELEEDVAPQPEENEADKGKLRLGRVVIVLPALIFAAFVLAQVWLPNCPFQFHCVSDERGSMEAVMGKLLISVVAIAPAVFATRYLQLRFKQNQASKP